MRDLLIVAIVFGSLPLILSRAYVGIWVWSWLGYMNPHRLAWGFAYNFPFSQVVAAATLVSVVYAKDKQKIPLTGLTAVWVMFLIWMCVTTVLATSPVDAQTQLMRILKVQLMCFMTIVLITNRRQLDILIWIIVGSLLFYGVKGGIAMLLAGRTIQMYGPGGFIGDNNALAIAILLTIPFLVYLRSIVTNKYVRFGMLLSLVPVAVAIIGSGSRAAFLGAGAMVGLLWLRSRSKLATSAALLLLIPFALMWAPDSWFERMSTITETDEQGQYEGSAQSRIETWSMIINLAKDRPVFGAGLDPWNESIYLRYSDTFQPGDLAQAAHSIYFSILAEHGFVGLLLFLLIFFIAWRTASRTIAEASKSAELAWLDSLMRMVQVSLAGYLVAGAFHQLPYFDLPWHILSIIVIGQILVRASQSSPRDVPAAQRMRYSNRVQEKDVAL